jgi:hypothetical protein
MPKTTNDAMRSSRWTWTPALLVLGSYALSLAVYGRLPDLVAADPGRLLPIDLPTGARSVSRIVAAFGLPTVALMVAALLHEAPVSRLGLAAGRALGAGPATANPPADFHKYAATYRLMVAWVVSLLLAFHAAILATALSWPIEPGRIVGLVLGAGLLIVGNVMPRLRPNAVAGIRTASTMGDPLLWARVHRTSGALWVAGGVAVLLVSWLAPRYALATGAGALLLSALAMLAASRVLASAVAMLLLAASTASLVP